jgi:hypothetical protein
LADFGDMKNKKEENEEEKELDELPPGIEEYSEQASGNIPISFLDQKELLYFVRARTGLETSVIEKILREYFQEVRTELLKNKEIMIKGLGKLILGKRIVKFLPTRKLNE